MKSKKSILFFIFFLLILVATQNKAMAINVQNFAPADGVGNGFSLYTSQTLKSQEWLTGMYINYDEKPLEIGLNNNDPRVAGIVDRFVTADAIITYGVLDNLNVTVDVPFNLYYNIAPTLVPTRDEGNLAMGDLRMSAKWQIVDALTSESHWGLALVPFLTVPTGNETIYFGSSSVTGGGIVAGEKRYGPHSLYMNAGARFQKQEQLGDLVISNAWLYGIGYKRLFSEEQAISGILEIQGSTTFRKFYHQEITSPAEFRAIIQKNWLASRRLHSYLGGGTGLTNGYGSPDFRLNAGVTFSFGPMP